MSKMLNIEDVIPNNQADIEKIIKAHKSRFNIPLYKRIMRDVSSKDTSTIDDIYFQTAFSTFYNINRFKSLEWQCEYYNVFKEMKGADERGEEVTIARIIRRLHKIKTDGKQMVELSFASKMLAAIDENKPIYDTNVAETLVIKKLSSKNKGIFWSAEDIYDTLESKYKNYKKHPGYNMVIDAFDKVCPEGKSISSVKKIDYILWSMGK